MIPKLRREKSYPHCGRIVVLDSRSQVQAGPNANEQNVSIEFPAMPDSIELARTAVYNVTPNFVMPDAIHMYKHTEPMQIPFSFSLHSFDSEYCQHGALSLLQLAARLHSLVLPVGDSKKSVKTQVQATSKTQALAPGEDPNKVKPKTETNLLARGNQGSVAVAAADYDHVSPPVTCRLELFFTSEGEPGLVCIGYVKDVKAVLKGPFMRGLGGSFNLPSSGDFSFTFMHRPAHYNNLSFDGARSKEADTEVQAYADHVLRNFYNNRELGGSRRGYRGFLTEGR